MKKISEFIKSEIVQCVIKGVSIAVMLVLVYIYLIHADLSTAPEFIYNQF